MPNSIKYSDSEQTLALKKSDFYIGTGDVGKGPTSTTGYYNGITPPSGGYTIYLNKASQGPSIYTAANDAGLITITNLIAAESFTTVAQCLDYFVTQTDKMCFNRDYERIVTDGLIIDLDAGFTPSYPRSGTTWYDVGGIYNGTLINGPTFSSGNGGSLVFDGANDYASVDVDSWIRSTSSAYTFSSFFYYNGGNSGGAPYSLMTFPNAGDTNDGFWQHLNLGNWLWRTEDNIAGEDGGNVEAPSPFSNGNWYHIATVVKTNSLIFYRNGSPVATISTSFNWANLRNDGDAYLYISTGYGENYYMNGNIGIFQMYNRELSAAEVLQNYNATKNRY